MQEQTISAKTPRGRRTAKALAVSVALTMATFGSVAAITAGTASASFSAVSTQNYTITGASSAITTMTAAVSPTTASATGATWTVHFVTPTALTVATSGASTITLSETAQANGAPAVVWTGVTPVSVADVSTGFAFGATGANLVVTATSLKVTLAASSGSINAGDTVAISFVATNPTVTTVEGNSAYTLSLVTSSATADTTTVTIVPVSPASVLTATPQSLNSGATYTQTNVTGLATAGGTITLQACSGSANVAACANSATSGGTGTVTFSQIASSYAVEDTNTGVYLTVGTPVTNDSGAGTNFVGGVKLPITVPSGDTVLLTDDLTITAVGTNPAAPEQDQFVAAIGATLSISNAVSFGGQVSGVTVALSNSATGGSSNYTVGFAVSSTGKALTSITLIAPNATVFSNAGAVVSDSTTGASQVIGSGAAALVLGQTKTSDDTLTITTTLTVNDGDAISVTVFGVTNPAQGTYAGTGGLEVYTSADVIPAYSAAGYAVGPVVVSSVNPSVTVSPNTPGSLATYTVGTFKAADALVGGTDSIEVQAEGSVGTEFPGTATITDATTASGTQTVTASSGTGTATVTYKLADNVAASDSLTLTMTSVVNPSGTGSGVSYYLELGADSLSNADAAGTQGLATPGIPFVGAAASYPDGGIVSFAGTDYSFAGGHAFAIAAADLTAFQAVDKATVQTAATGATVPTTAPATGAVIVALNNPTIYVVGTDGQLHGFATPTQFLGDGFDPAAVILVDSITGLTVGATAGSVGAGANAVATSANGALADSSGTFYVFAGGRAFGIPGPKGLLAVEAADTATPLLAAVTTSQTGATVRQGTLVTLNSAVYVANSSNNLLEFKAMGQLTKDGYGGTPSIPVAGVSGLGVVTAYVGS